VIVILGITILKLVHLFILKEIRKMPECKHKKILICDTEVCPTCYEEEMMRSRDRAKDVKLEMVYDPGKHFEVLRKVKV
jgi:hypothetical protein